jgi:hypothetical protein
VPVGSPPPAGTAHRENRAVSTVPVTLSTKDGGNTVVEFVIGQRIVAIMRGTRSLGTVDRGDLARWLAAPMAPFLAGAVTLYSSWLDAQGNGHVSISLPDTGEQPLSASERAALELGVR